MVESFPMRIYALLCLLCLTACATEVSVPPLDAGGSADTAADGSSADTDTGADTTAADTGSDAGAVCPAEPFSSEACDQEGTQCNYGSECCCGTCYPSSFCTCSGGRWACGSTDACMRPSCEGSTCATDADCIGGAPSNTLLCTAGLCTVAPVEGGCFGLAQPDCDTHNAAPCTWLAPSGCPDSTLTSLGEAGCYPAADCTSDTDCPTDAYCEPQLQVAPRCMWMEPLCDACNETRGVCLPRGI